MKDPPLNPAQVLLAALQDKRSIVDLSVPLVRSDLAVLSVDELDTLRKALYAYVVASTQLIQQGHLIALQLGVLADDKHCNVWGKPGAMEFKRSPGFNSTAPILQITVAGKAVLHTWADDQFFVPGPWVKEVPHVADAAAAQQAAIKADYDARLKAELLDKLTGGGP